jgi:hypothetical protein
MLCHRFYSGLAPYFRNPVARHDLNGADAHKVHIYSEPRSSLHPTLTHELIAFLRMRSTH